MANCDTLLTGTRKGLLIWRRQPSSGWKLERECFVGVRATFATVDSRTGTLWCGLDHGHFGVKLHRSSDLGISWVEVAAPKYPEGAMIRPDKPATLQYIWCIEPGGNDRPQRLYIGTIPGGLFRSDDGGESWALMESLWNHPSRSGWFGGGFDEAGVHSICVVPRDNRRVRVGVSVSGMFETNDDGNSWVPKNRGLKATFLPDPDVEVGHDPHLIVASPNNPDALWQQNHCGIFRTSDGGAQWQQVSQPGNVAHFGFAVAVDARNSDIAWVVPAVADEQRVAVNRALCVCRTDDGGHTWSEFRAGLPQENCYDFVFRHGLDIDGDRLATGTAGGCLYVSDDRGESWQTIAEHLAPVYSCRFAAGPIIRG